MHGVSVLDPILASPYRPAAREKPHIEAGHTSAPDHMPTEGKNLLAFTGGAHTSGLHFGGRLRPFLAFEF
jgi:hypothetical protein